MNTYSTNTYLSSIIDELITITTTGGSCIPYYAHTTDPYYMQGFPPLTETYLNWNTVVDNFNFKSKIDTPKYPKSSCFIQEDGTINIHLAVTGFSKEELSIKQEGEKIIISGEKDKTTNNTVNKEVWNNISQKNFETIFSFNEKMNLEKITINLENGILSIVVPMHEKNKPVVKELEIL